MRAAIAAGADVLGYLFGLSWINLSGPRIHAVPRLIPVDYEPQRRTRKASASWRAQMLAASHQASPPIYVSTAIEAIALAGEKCSDAISASL
jgi:hypothetical protein